jgi:hypothetical protein
VVHKLSVCVCGSVTQGGESSVGASHRVVQKLSVCVCVCARARAVTQSGEKLRMCLTYTE